MVTMQDYVYLMLSAALVNNVILARFLGLCSFMGVTTRWTPQSAWAWRRLRHHRLVNAQLAVEAYLLKPYDLLYLRTVTFILVIAALCSSPK